MANWYDKTGTPEVAIQAGDSGAEPEYLHRDDLAYGQLATEIAKGGLAADEDSDFPPRDGWLSDM